ncbi:MAG: YbaB/EbfC family nucleoid-associated protein [Gemmatimonadota bacterium]|nr:YbaB/EbfC family nucleoid-associated protein [Gemmatimonadota bacterium]
MDFLKMMQQASQMQAKVQQLQAELGLRRVTGVAAGGKVSVTLDGHGQVQGVHVDPSLLGTGDAAVLEDLVLVAMRSAQGQAQALVAEEMGKLTGGLDLPLGMKLPNLM